MVFPFKFECISPALRQAGGPIRLLPQKYRFQLMADAEVPKYLRRHYGPCMFETPEPPRVNELVASREVGTAIKADKSGALRARGEVYLYVDVLDQRNEGEPVRFEFIDNCYERIEERNILFDVGPRTSTRRAKLARQMWAEHDKWYRQQRKSFEAEREEWYEVRLNWEVNTVMFAAEQGWPILFPELDSDPIDLTPAPSTAEKFTRNAIVRATILEEGVDAIVEAAQSHDVVCDKQDAELFLYPHSFTVQGALQLDGDGQHPAEFDETIQRFDSMTLPRFRFWRFNSDGPIDHDTVTYPPRTTLWAKQPLALRSRLHVPGFHCHSTHTLLTHPVTPEPEPEPKRPIFIFGESPPVSHSTYGSHPTHVHDSSTYVLGAPWLQRVQRTQYAHSNPIAIAHASPAARAKLDSAETEVCFDFAHLALETRRAAARMEEGLKEAARRRAAKAAASSAASPMLSPVSGPAIRLFCPAGTRL